MHICFITSEYPKENFSHGGLGTFVQTIARELVQKKHKVTIVGFNYIQSYEIEIDKGITVYRLKPAKIKGVSWLINARNLNKQLKKIHQKAPIDIVESAELGLVFIKKAKNIKYVIRLHGGHHFFAESEHRGINAWKGFQEKKSFKKTDGFIAVSDYVKKHTSKYLSYHNKPILKIETPINLTVFQPRPDETVKEFSILFAGTVCEKKGIRHLILAMPFVLKHFPKAELNIYGRDWFFPNGKSYIEYLKKEVLPTIDGKNKINFHGAVAFKKIPKKYAKAHVCVFPSHMETQGLVAPEAMAMEKPVVFTKLGPGSEVIKHEYNGLLCDPYSPKDIAEKICFVFNNKNKAIEMSKKGRLTIEQNYNIENAIKKNLDYYSSLLL